MEDTQLLMEFTMIDRKIIWVRIIIAVATFILLSSILLDWILIKARESSFRWHPDPVKILLFVASFIMLANGVSYLSEIFKNDKNAIKRFTGILALTVFAFTLFPQDQDINPIIGWIILVGVSLSSILISLCLTLEWVQKRSKWLLSFVFAINGGIYGWIIAAFILRGSNYSESGIGLIGYAAIISILSTMVNLGVLSALKNDVRRD